MRLTVLTGLVAAGLMLAGALLWFVIPSDEASFYGFATADGAELPWLLFLTTNRVVGAVLFWVGSLLAAGLVGHHLARPGRFGRQSGDAR